MFKLNPFSQKILHAAFNFNNYKLIELKLFLSFNKNLRKIKINLEQKTEEEKQQSVHDSNNPATKILKRKISI